MLALDSKVPKSEVWGLVGKGGVTALFEGRGVVIIILGVLSLSLDL